MKNFKALAEGQYRYVETGNEPASKGSFKLPEAGAGSAPAKDTKAKAPPAKDAGKKGGVVVDEEANKKAEEERKLEAQREAEKLREMVESRDKRMHPHMGLWLDTKIRIIRVLLSQKRFEDCADAIAVTRLES